MSPRQIITAIAYLKRDKNLRTVLESSPRPKYTQNQDPFESLVRSIIFQQLSGKAAGTILKRFHALFKNNKPTPQTLLKLKDEKFKSAGVSGQKTGYLKDLAEKFLDGTIDPTHFHEMTDEAIREHLIAVKGIGRWTADMFLMFTLHRSDVLPTGDLGIQKGFQKIFKLRSLPDAKRMEKLALPWQPYRTIACHYLWRSVDGDTEGGDW